MPTTAERSGRNFSAWIGLVPKQHSSGGRDRLGSISKQGDRYLRSLFVAGALAVIRYAKIHGTKYRPWMAEALRLTKVAMSAREIAARLEGQLAAQQSLPWWKNSPVDQQRSRAAAGV